MARSLLAAIVAGSVSLFFFDGLSFPQSAGCFMIVLGLAGAALRLARSSHQQAQALGDGQAGAHGAHPAPAADQLESAGTVVH